MKRKVRSLFTVLLTALMIMTMLSTTAFAASNKVPSKANVTKVSASTNAATVKWKKAKNATSYRIYYKKNGTNDWIAVANVSGKKTSYKHKSNKKTPLVGGTKYSYAVRAYNKSSKKWSNYGSAKSVTIPAIPGKTNIASVKAIATNKVTITWNKTTNATSYRIFYKKSGAKKWSTLANVGSNATSYTHTSNKKASLSVGKKYVYTVRAYNKSSKKWGSYNTKGVTVTIPKKNPAPSTPSNPNTPTPNPSTPSNPNTPTPQPTKPTHTHSYEWVVTSQPSCTEVGIKEYKCKTCGNVADTATIPKTSHTAGTPVKENVQEATCKWEGSYEERVYCTKCHALISSKHVTTPKADHQWELLDDSNPSCESNGYTDYVCKVCATMNTITKPALGHTYGEEKVEIQPTTHLAGYTSKRCTKCNHLETKELPKLTTPYITEDQVRARLNQLRTKYPNGTHDTEEAINCDAFATTIQKEIFGNHAAYRHTNINDLHVGDMVRIKGNDKTGGQDHSSIILSVDGDKLITADGNVSGYILWDNQHFLKSEIMYVITYY